MQIDDGGGRTQRAAKYTIWTEWHRAHRVTNFVAESVAALSAAERADCFHHSPVGMINRSEVHMFIL